MTKASQLGVGLYTVADAERLLRTPRRTLGRWLEGYSEGGHSYLSVIREPDHTWISFAHLIELMYVREFRKAGVPLGVIRDTSLRFQNEFQNAFPFSTKRFAVSGRDLLVTISDEWQCVRTGQQWLRLGELIDQLYHVGEFVTEWRPLGQDGHIALNPNKRFGRPHEIKTGADTSVLYGFYKAGDSIETIADWYGISLDAMTNVVSFEESLKSKSRDRVFA